MCFSRFRADCQNVKKQRFRTKILTCQKLTKNARWRYSPHQTRNGPTRRFFYAVDFQRISFVQNLRRQCRRCERYMFHLAKDRLSGCERPCFATRNLSFRSRKIYVSPVGGVSIVVGKLFFHLAKHKKKMLKRKSRFNISRAESYSFQFRF